MLTHERDVVLGRQGIHGERGVIGYELLFRSAVRSSSAPPLTGDQMTADVLFGAMSIGLATLAQNRLIFCNADRGLLVGEVPIPLPAASTVIEVLETIDVDDEIVRACQALKRAGYRIALDDFVYGSGHEQLLPMADIVKIDLLATTETDRADIIARCREFPVTFVAEKVETREEIPSLRRAGFSLYQGYALDKPVLVRGKTVTPTDASSIQSAVDLLSREADFAELESIIRRDPALTHQILKLASSGSLGENSRAINTVRDALVRCGSKQIQTWLGLLLARRAGPGHDTQDAVINVLLRARACELLAAECGVDSQFAFTAGMLSALDHLLRVDSEDIADSLDLTPELRSAAFGTESTLARLIQELADWSAPHRPAASLPVAPAQVEAAYASAFAWAISTAVAI